MKTFYKTYVEMQDDSIVYYYFASLFADVTREKVGTMDKIKDGLKHEMDEFGAATGLQGWQVMALVVTLVILIIGLCGWCVFRFFRKKRKAKKGEETRI